MSVRLRTKDLEGVLAFASDALDADAPEPLTTELLDQLTTLVGCALATYQELDWSRRLVTAYVPCSNEDPLAVLPPYVPPEYWTADEWPYRNGRPFEKVSDRLDRRERERIRDEEEFNSEFRIVDRIGLLVGDRGTRSRWLHFDSDARDSTSVTASCSSRSRLMPRRSGVGPSLAGSSGSCSRRSTAAKRLPGKLSCCRSPTDESTTRPRRPTGYSPSGSALGTAACPSGLSIGLRSRVLKSGTSSAGTARR